MQQALEYGAQSGPPANDEDNFQDMNMGNKVIDDIQMSGGNGEGVCGESRLT